VVSASGVCSETQKEINSITAKTFLPRRLIWAWKPLLGVPAHPPSVVQSLQGYSRLSGWEWPQNQPAQGEQRPRQIHCREAPCSLSLLLLCFWALPPWNGHLLKCAIPFILAKTMVNFYSLPLILEMCSAKATCRRWEEGWEIKEQPSVKPKPRTLWVTVGQDLAGHLIRSSTWVLKPVVHIPEHRVHITGNGKLYPAQPSPRACDWPGFLTSSLRTASFWEVVVALSSSHFIPTPGPAWLFQIHLADK
jgi:hypothetical protein